MARHPIEVLWRKVGLPEYFLGNDGTNTKLYALYDAIRSDPESIPAVRISVRGDCGIIHPTFEDWQHCKACERSLARALLS